MKLNWKIQHTFTVQQTSAMYTNNTRPLLSAGPAYLASCMAGVHYFITRQNFYHPKVVQWASDWSKN